MRVEKLIVLNAPVDSVWDALTNPVQTRKYFHGCEAISDWQKGSTVHWQSEVDGQSMIHVRGIITEVEPCRILEHTCYAEGNADKPETHTTARYELRSDGTTTELSATQGEIQDEDQLAAYNASWDQVLAGLKSLVESEAVL